MSSLFILHTSALRHIQIAEATHFSIRPQQSDYFILLSLLQTCVFLILWFHLVTRVMGRCEYYTCMVLYV